MAEAAKKRMLIIVNPYARTVSDRLKNLVVYALQGRYEVEAVSTESQNHATEIGREASEGGYDIVVAFGGDGTLNEVANGLAGTDVPVSILPGGSTNVVARTLGIPNDVVEATEHLLALADDFAPRPIDLGMAGDRYFVFSCGIGIDATVVERVESNPKLKARGGPYYYVYSAIAGFYRRYLLNPVWLRVEADGETVEGVTALAQNSNPFTYFSKRPIRVCTEVEIDDGTLSVGVLLRAAQRDTPTLVARLLSERGLAGHRAVRLLNGIGEATVTSISPGEGGAPRPVPVQVDGDYLGERESVRLRVVPGALRIVA
ncbi:MAG: diacylglycerol kinase family protein [Solirubrobacterales bacterium]